MGRKRKQLPLITPSSETQDDLADTPISEGKSEAIPEGQSEHTQTLMPDTDETDNSEYDGYSSEFANQLFYRYTDLSQDGFVYLLSEIELQFQAATAVTSHEQTPSGEDVRQAARRTALHAVHEATERYLRHLTDLEAREAAGVFHGQGYEPLNLGAEAAKGGEDGPRLGRLH